MVRGYATGGGKTICGNDEGQEQEAVPRAKSLAKLAHVPGWRRRDELLCFVLCMPSTLSWLLLGMPILAMTKEVEGTKESSACLEVEQQA